MKLFKRIPKTTTSYLKNKIHGGETYPGYLDIKGLCFSAINSCMYTHVKNDVWHLVHNPAERQIWHTVGFQVWEGFIDDYCKRFRRSL